MSGDYRRHAPDLPRQYTVSTAHGRAILELCAPVVDALGAEPGDAVTVRRNDRDEIVLERGTDDADDRRCPA
jgi:hypothetical protein